MVSVAGLAQLVEHLICNQRVVGSSPTTGTSFKTHQTVRFLFGFSCPFDFCTNRNFAVGRTVFILIGARNSNQNLPHAPKTPKTVMRMAIVLLLEQHGV